MRQFSAVLLALLTLAACASPTASTVPAGSDVRLRPGERVAVEGTDVAVRFDGVAQDSRCPADAICVTLGDAEAVFTVTQAGRPNVPLTLHTAPGEGQRAAAFGFLLTLTHLDPYPYAGRPTAPQDYRASLRIDPIAGS